MTARAIPKAEAAELPKVQERKQARLDLNPVPATVKSEPAGVDMDKLAWAVAMQETKNCTDPNAVTGRKRNNCHGIMYWPDGVRTQRTFPNIQASHDAFKDIWLRVYGNRLPTMADARKYSGNDKAESWYRNVHHFYHSKP